MNEPSWNVPLFQICFPEQGAAGMAALGCFVSQGLLENYLDGRMVETC